MTNKLVAALGTVLRKRRLQLSLSIAEVAELAQVEEGVVEHFEENAEECSIGVLIVLSEALNTTSSHLFEQAELLAKGSQN